MEVPKVQKKGIVEVQKKGGLFFMFFGSNVLFRAPRLTTQDPTFENGIWKDIKHAVVLDISYNGMMECFKEGNALLGGRLSTDLVSVHDPDEYLAQVEEDSEQYRQRLQDILDAYRALFDLKSQGLVTSVGIGAKCPKIIEFVVNHCPLDWVMMACVITPYVHTAATQLLLKRLAGDNIHVINAGVFHGGFLVGEPYFNYALADSASVPELFKWRETFFAVCAECGHTPAAVCVQFSFRFPAICSVALNADCPQRVIDNYNLVYGPPYGSHITTTTASSTVVESDNTSGDEWDVVWSRLLTAGLTTF